MSVRERERENRESKLFYSIHEFRRSKLDRLGVKVALCDKSSAWISESQDFVKAQGSGFFFRNLENAVSWEIMLFELEFFSYSG